MESNFDNIYQQALHALNQQEEKNYLKLIVELAERGHAQSQIDLASIYTAGFYDDYPKSIDEALKWHLSALSSENPDNYFCLALLYGEDFDDPTKTFDSCEKTSEEYYKLAFNGYQKRASKGCSSAMHRVGEMLALGLGVTRDTKKATIWFEKCKTNNGLKDRE